MTDCVIDDALLLGGTDGAEQIRAAANTLQQNAEWDPNAAELQTIQRELLFERSHQRCEHQQWRFALPQNLAVAVELTADSLTQCTQDWLQASNSELRLEKDFVVPWSHATPSDVFYREETWGGGGAQPFKLGDMLIGDVLPESIQKLNIGSCLQWKQTAARDVITRTLPVEIFTNTYTPHVLPKKNSAQTRLNNESLLGRVSRHASNTSTDGALPSILQLTRSDSAASSLGGGSLYAPSEHPLLQKRLSMNCGTTELCENCSKAQRVAQIVLQHSGSGGMCLPLQRCVID